MPLVEAETSNLTWEEEQAQYANEGYRSEQRYRHSSMSEEQYQGAINAVKKAYQLTNISFTPLRPIAYNIGTYQPNYSYKGMIYSSVKEIGTYVGNSISFHTFMTAIHNPRSRIYTDRIDEAPYHGKNCRSYYGTVCSSLVSYALGLFPVYGSFDFASSEEMEELEYSQLDSLHIADVLWRSGHVAIVTNVVRDADDRIVSIEISEALQNGCKRRSAPRSSFLRSIAPTFKKALRYKDLKSNLFYSSAPEFVTVLDEEPLPFVYNSDICVDKGDRSCYFVGDKVTLNILSSGDVVEIFKDGLIYSVIDVTSEDVQLSDLGYGQYQARLIAGGRSSDFTSWFVVDRTIHPSLEEMKLYFNSENATPISAFVCDRTGGRISNVTNTICRQFTEEEINSGYMEIPQERLLTDNPYFIVTFATDFGKISTTPIEWK